MVHAILSHHDLQVLAMTKKSPTMHRPKLIKSLEQHKNIITTGRFWAFFFSKHVYFVHSRLNAKGCCLSCSFQAFDSKTYLFGFCFLFDGVLLLAFITNFQLLDILRARKAAFSVLHNFQFISSANQLSNFSKSSSTIGLFIYLLRRIGLFIIAAKQKLKQKHAHNPNLQSLR